MNNQHNQLQNDNNKGQPASGGQSDPNQDENVKISMPHIDRPEGPFEHSGETFNWTEEEKVEKTQQPDGEQESQSK
jgi:hypothetical protein